MKRFFISSKQLALGLGHCFAEKIGKKSSFYLDFSTFAE
jgi:hypothetical protein